MPNPHLNPQALQWQYRSTPSSSITKDRLSLQKLLPNYSSTPLHSLPSLAKDLQLRHVLLKDESRRFGLPSFKILGASWAVYCALVHELAVNEKVASDEIAGSLDEVRKLARESGINIVTCTAGNWGRAVARMGSWLGVDVVVYVAEGMAEETRGLIRGEGATVVVVEGHYGDAVGRARERVVGGGRDLLVMDIGWRGYDEVPGVSYPSPFPYSWGGFILSGLLGMIMKRLI